MASHGALPALHMRNADGDVRATGTLRCLDVQRHLEGCVPWCTKAGYSSFLCCMILLYLFVFIFPSGNDFCHASSSYNKYLGCLCHGD